MRTTLTFLVLAFLSVGFGFVRATPAYGCSCIEVRVEDAIPIDAPGAFIGTAVSVEDLGDGGLLADGSWSSPLQWTFEVETVLAGDLPEVLVVGTGRDDGDCGYDFSQAGRIGVVAFGQPGNLNTGICGGIWDADVLVAAHGPGHAPFAAPVPIDDAGSSWPLWPFVFGAAGLAIVATAVLWRRIEANREVA